MIQAIIFDMDGVIADTQMHHAQIESEILSQFDIMISPEEITKRFAGVRTEDFFKELLIKKQVDFDIKVLMAEKWRKINEVCNKELNSIPGVVGLIKEAVRSEIKLAVASASSHDFICMVLDKLKIKDYFSEIVSAYEVERGKPQPDIFLLAAKKLGIVPELCVVIEDGVHGMNAARAAGMKCIGLTNDKTAPADLIINNFSEINIDTIKNL